jgi:hypothetical protein
VETFVSIVIFLIGLTLVVASSIRLWWVYRKPQPRSRRHWTCPDENCDWRGRHARYLVTHIMMFHPRLVPDVNRRD